MQNLEVMVMLFTMVILGYAACKLGYMVGCSKSINFSTRFLRRNTS